MTAVASSLALVVIGPRHSPLSVVLVAVSTGACGFVAVFERRSPCLGIRPIAAAITLVFTVAVVVPPRSSNDLWSYTMYGRAVSVHSESPYERVPADFPSDPFLSRVSPVWRHRASLFGPAFVGFASVGTSLAGDSALANRLFFQLAAAAAAAVVLVILWRRTRSPAALTWLGLHPAFGALAINGGHIDVLIGLGILSAALLAARHRGALAGLVIGPAVLATQVVRLLRTARRKRRLGELIPVLPLTTALLTAWSMGEWLGWSLAALEPRRPASRRRHERAVPPPAPLPGRGALRRRHYTARRGGA